MKQTGWALRACWLLFLAAACADTPGGPDRNTSWEIIVGEPISRPGEEWWGGFQFSPTGEEILFEAEPWTESVLKARRIDDRSVRTVDPRPMPRVGFTLSRDGTAVLQYVMDPLYVEPERERLERIALDGSRVDTIARDVVAFAEADTMYAVTVRAATCGSPSFGGCDTLKLVPRSGGRGTAVGLGAARLFSPDATRLVYAEDPCVAFGPDAVCQIMILDLRDQTVAATRFTERNDDVVLGRVAYTWDDDGLRQHTNPDGYWRIVDEATGAVIAYFPGGAAHSRWASGGQLVAGWVASIGDGTATLTAVQNPSGISTRIALVPLQSGWGPIALSPDARQIAYEWNSVVFLDSLP
jgi:hypothetical protein